MNDIPISIPISIPRVVIAAPASGSGKTTIATGLIAALRLRGHRVAPFKVGPDYIDPGYHALAANRPGRNLDPVLVGEERIAPLFTHGATNADLAIIEGVMGLFDGRSTAPSAGRARRGPEPSTGPGFGPAGSSAEWPRSAGPGPAGSRESGSPGSRAAGSGSATDSGSAWAASGSEPAGSVSDWPGSTGSAWVGSGSAGSESAGFGSAGFGSEEFGSAGFESAGYSESGSAGSGASASGAGSGAPGSGSGGAGFGGAGFGSTAHVARLLDAPVVLVVDSRGQGRSLAALLHGFRGYEPGVRLAAVVLNQVGSPRHEEVLREACDEIGLPVLGAVRRGAEVSLPSRHLGLIPAAEHGEAAMRAVHAMAELIAASIDLDAVCRLAASAGRLPGHAWDPHAEVGRFLENRVTGVGPADRATEVGPADRFTGVGPADRATEVGLTDLGSAANPGEPAAAGAYAGADSTTPAGPATARHPARPTHPARPVVAIAGGPAFTFGYAEHTELLLAAGAEVVVFDPLRDETLPEGLGALILPGGFPEQHASSLSANAQLLSEVSRFARSGGLVQGECGGLLLLLDELSGERMCGVVPGKAELAPHLVLGYRDAVVATDSAAHRVGERRTGHEFHRTHVINTDTKTTTEPAWFWRDHGGRAVREGFVHRGVHASYLHTHPAGQPETVVRLVLAAARAGENT